MKKTVLRILVMIVVFSATDLLFSYLRPTFPLAKADWVCTQSKHEQRLVFVQVGKVFNPLTEDRWLCVQWTRR